MNEHETGEYERLLVEELRAIIQRRGPITLTWVNGTQLVVRSRATGEKWAEISQRKTADILHYLLHEPQP